jgi:hypothetical protein
MQVVVLNKVVLNKSCFEQKKAALIRPPCSFQPLLSQQRIANGHMPNKKATLRWLVSLRLLLAIRPLVFRSRAISAITAILNESMLPISGIFNQEKYVHTTPRTRSSQNRLSPHYTGLLLRHHGGRKVDFPRTTEGCEPI